VRLRLLGTGASGGTPGRGRSRRLESSALVGDGATVLVDLTRDFRVQSAAIERLDAVLLTHAHRDAAGGVGALRRWWRAHGIAAAIPVYSHARTLAALESRYVRLDHCRLVPAEPGQPLRVGDFEASALEVPHAADPRFPTFAWRLESAAAALVYASDVARLTPELERFSRGATVLVLDGAMWGRPLFSHLRADQALPVVCGWQVERILLTQIGRTAPAHEQLERQVRALCQRARPAWDGLELVIPESVRAGRAIQGE
jgi:phosphoribosyl 1,2-cyclic phosphate phosphodiesterase